MRLALALFAVLLAAPGGAQSRVLPLRLPAELQDYSRVYTVAGPELLRLRYSIGGCGCPPPLPDPTAKPPGPARDERVDRLATLGRVLFYDTRLSNRKRVSCATCHRQEHAFADPRPRSRGFLGRKTKRNSLAIVNVGLSQDQYFWDGRVHGLEAMVLMPIQDSREMALNLRALEKRVRADARYAKLFRAAFGDEKIDSARIGASLAAFVSAMTSFRSRFDYGLRTVTSVKRYFPNFTVSENRGKAIFFGVDRPMKNSCASCHARVQHKVTQFLFQNWEFANNGLDGASSKRDPGRGGVTKKSPDRGKFRLPSLRNIELTAPYMHDGRFTTLEEVVEFYANGVRDVGSLDPRMVARNTVTYAGGLTHRVRGFPMTTKQRADLVAFLKTLTDRKFVEDRRFSDPFIRREVRR